jgi:hypothetical protein
VRFVDIKNWSSASDVIVDRLKMGLPHIFLMKSLGKDIKSHLNDYIFELESLIFLKDISMDLQNKSFKINQILFYKNGKIIGVIKNNWRLRENICFKLLIPEKGIEETKANARIFYASSELAYVEFYWEKGDEDYWMNVAQTASKEGRFIPGAHRLELIVPMSLNIMTIEELKGILCLLKKMRGEHDGKNYWKSC